MHWWRAAGTCSTGWPPCYPTLALIQGHCLGGGLELALACRYRLVADQAGVSLALPEVMLGIFPGWGGMLRLPRLIGAPAALDMMLTGRGADARRAAALGLADARVPPRLLEAAARHGAVRQAGAPDARPGRLDQPLAAQGHRRQPRAQADRGRIPWATIPPRRPS